jgi:hypothetical protein
MFIFNLQRGKRISKVRVLQRAIDYICNMHEMIREFDGIDDDVGGRGGADGDGFVDDSHLFAF